MMLINYPHSKKIYKLNFMEFQKKIIKNLLNIILKFQESFTTWKWGVMYMTSKVKFYFMIKKS